MASIREEEMGSEEMGSVDFFMAGVWPTAKVKPDRGQLNLL
jgi:hypothetical protein